MKTSLVLTYVGAFLAFLAALTGIFGWFPAEIAWAVASLLGCGSIAALRTFIESTGKKTYVMVALQILNSILFGLNLYPLEFYQQVTELIAAITIGTVAIAVKKVQEVA